MKTLFGILLTLFFLYESIDIASAQQKSAYIIRLKDKKESRYSFSNPSAYLSARAINRRVRQNIPLDSSDLPVSGPYLDSIRSAGNLDIPFVLKWQNEVCIYTADPAVLQKIRGFSFVKEILPVERNNGRLAGQPSVRAIATIPATTAGITQAATVATIPAVTAQAPLRGTFPQDVQSFPAIEKQRTNEEQCAIEDQRANEGQRDEDRPAAIARTTFESPCSTPTLLSYGSSFDQIHIHQGEYLHNQGFMGQGMLIAVLDAGFFRYKTNPAFDSLRLQNRIQAEWDFVAGEASVNEDHAHGMICLSMMTSNLPGVLVGSAPAAAYLLLRTEDVSMEMPVEEYNWAAAAEYADSAGADMISSSLGYVNFDDPTYNHSYAQRDGRTSVITRAANKAAGKGILVMSSAGNDGAALTDLKFVACPADGDSVLAVGAVNSQGAIAAFSDWGPNAAGKIKPDVVSVGESAFYTLSTGVPAQASGTSLSNPNLAGLVACLWQAYPEFTNMEIMEAVRQSAHKYNSPDERYGYGIPDLKIASDILSKARSDRHSANILGGEVIKAYPVPFKDVIKLVIDPPASGRCEIRLMDITGRLIRSAKLEVSRNTYAGFSWSGLNGLCSGIYLLQCKINSNNFVIKLVK